MRTITHNNTFPRRNKKTKQTIVSNYNDLSLLHYGMIAWIRLRTHKACALSPNEIRLNFNRTRLHLFLPQLVGNPIRISSFLKRTLYRSFGTQVNYDYWIFCPVCYTAAKPIKNHATTSCVYGSTKIIRVIISEIDSNCCAPFLPKNHSASFKPEMFV